MDLKNLLKSLENCPCGREHTFDTKVVEIYSGLTKDTGKILLDAGFPTNILLVADENTLGVANAEGLCDALDASGVHGKKRIYQTMMSRLCLTTLTALSPAAPDLSTTSAALLPSKRTRSSVSSQPLPLWTALHPIPRPSSRTTSRYPGSFVSLW